MARSRSRPLHSGTEPIPVVGGPVSRRGRVLPRRPVRVSSHVLKAADDFRRALLVEGDAHQLACRVHHLPVAIVLADGVAGLGGGGRCGGLRVGHGTFPDAVELRSRRAAYLHVLRVDGKLDATYAGA